MWAGVTTFSSDELTYVTVGAVIPPKESDAECSNPEPLMVTAVPPWSGPLAGPTLLIASGTLEWFPWYA